MWEIPVFLLLVWCTIGTFCLAILYISSILENNKLERDMAYLSIIFGPAIFPKILYGLYLSIKIRKINNKNKNWYKNEL